MKVFAIFAFIQIVGILGNPIAPEYDQAQTDEIEKLQALESIFSGFGSPNLNDYPDELTRQGKMKCRMNGGMNAESSGVEGMETYLDSVMKLTDETQLHFETVYDAPHGGLVPAAKIVCNWVTRYNALIKNLMHSFKPCWSTRESTSADLMYNISSALVEYACENEGSRLLTFLIGDGDACLSSAGYGIQSCFSTSVSRNTSVIENADNIHPMNVPWEVPIISLNTQACREFGTLQQCIVKVLRGCPNPTPSYEVNSLFNIVKNTSGCENFLQE